MLTESIKNFVKYLKYIFIVMGVCYFFLLIAFVFFVRGGVSIIANQGQETFQEILDYIASQRNSELALLVRGDFWTGLLSDILDIIRENGEISLVSIGSVVAASVTLIFMGLKLSEVVGGYFLRKEIRDSNTKRGLFRIIIRIIIAIVFSVLLSAFLFIWPIGGAILFVVYLISAAIENLFSVCYIYYTKEERKRILRPLNIIKGIGISLLCYLIMIAFFLLLFYFLSSMVALILILPLFGYADLVTEGTYVTYFRKKYISNYGGLEQAEKNEKPKSAKKNKKS